MQSWGGESGLCLLKLDNDNKNSSITNAYEYVNELGGMKGCELSCNNDQSHTHILLHREVIVAPCHLKLPPFKKRVSFINQ